MSPLPEHPVQSKPEQRPVDYFEEALALAEGALRAGTGQHFMEVATTAEDLAAYGVGIALEAPESRLHSDEPVDRVLSEVQAAWIREDALKLPADPQMWPPWVRFAVEFILMERSVDRLQEMVDRYAHVRAILIDRPIPKPVATSLKDLVELYLWGFDAQAVAFACTCFESVAKQVLIAVGHVTEPQLKRERPAAEELRNDLQRAGLLAGSSSDIEYLIRQRNLILHGNMTDEPLASLSRRSLATLVEVLRQLHPAWPRETSGLTPNQT